MTPDRQVLLRQSGRYRTIVVDPPWDHSDGTGVNLHGAETVTTGLPYAPMPLAGIAALPVASLAEPDAHLYLWTTSRYLRDAFDIAAGWGFQYSATLVWCKQSRGFSMGGTYQNNVEFIWYGRRVGNAMWRDILPLTTAMADAAEIAGLSRRDIDTAMGTSDMAGWWLSKLEHRCACPSEENWPRLKTLLGLGDEWDALVSSLNASKKVSAPVQAATSRWFQWPRGAHSAKPEAFIDMVETVSPGPHVELFARRARFGWAYWGDQSLGTADLPEVA